MQFVVFIPESIGSPPQLPKLSTNEAIKYLDV